MEPFKNEISPALVGLISRLLARHAPGTDTSAFETATLPQLDRLELKQRVALIADVMHDLLPRDPEARRSVLLAMLHPDDEGHANASSTDDGLCGWGIRPLTTVVGRHGLGSLEQSLETLREMTKRGTSEFDVRPFIAADPARALAVIGSWVTDQNVHVRRLVSEGTRPRLPWGMRLHALVEAPSALLPILAELRDDPAEYVRRSVANHLNDIAKDHPDLVARIATDWMEGADKTRVRLLRHACRTLIKQGHSGALAAFGIHSPQIAKPEIRIATPTVLLGNALTFDVNLRSTNAAEQRLIIDYVIHHRKANGTLSPKVFKWTTMTLAPGQALNLTRHHKMKPITTRTYHAGEHLLALRINGKDFGEEYFALKMPAGLSRS